MNSSLTSRLSLIVTTILLLTVQAHAQQPEAFTELIEAICASATASLTLTNFGDCGNKLDRDFKEAVDENGKISQIAYCCAVTSLRFCVLEKIGDACGSNAEKTADKVANLMVNAFKFVKGGDLPCEGNENYFREVSPICWPIWGHALAMVAILVFLCCCCASCMRERRRPVIIRHPHPRRGRPEYIPRVM